MRLRGTLTTLIATAGLLGAAGGASGAVLYSQVPNGSFTVPTVPSFVWPNNANRDTLAADDFSVGEGQVWVIESVEAAGAAGQGSGTDLASVTLYTGGPSPGAPLFTQNGIPLTNQCATSSQCDIQPPLSGAPRLEPGSYWVSVQTQVVGPGNGYEWRWATHPPGQTFGNPAVWQNPGDFYGTGCTTFRRLLECGLTEADDGSDLIFRLHGQLVDSRFDLGSFESDGNKIKLRATFPGPGQVQLKGKKFKKVTKTVGAGTRLLPIKLTKGAKRKLAKGRSVKLKVGATFTADGGVPFVQRASVKVVPARVPAGEPLLRPVP